MYVCRSQCVTVSVLQSVYVCCGKCKHVVENVCESQSVCCSQCVAVSVLQSVCYSQCMCVAVSVCVL